MTLDIVARRGYSSEMAQQKDIGDVLLDMQRRLAKALNTDMPEAARVHAQNAYSEIGESLEAVWGSRRKQPVQVAGEAEAVQGGIEQDQPRVAEV